MDMHYPLTHQLGTLLNNSEGVQLFHKFLSSTFSSGHFLDFWFACKGFRSIVDGDDQLKLLQVAKAIYRNYIKSGATSAVPVNESTKREIRSTLAAFSHSYHKAASCDKRLPALRSLFDTAQADVQNLLARSYFLEFLQTESFRKMHQLPALSECNSCVPTKSSHHGFYDQTDNIKRSNYLPKAGSHQSRTQSSSDDCPSCDVPATDQPPPLPQPIVPDLSPLKHTSNSAAATVAATTGSRRTELVTATELIAFMKPATRIDNPLSPDAPMTTTAATTAANQHQVGQPAAVTTTRKPGTNLAEVDPSAFALTLSHRLEKVKESRGKMERLLSKMQPADPEDIRGEDAEMASIHADLTNSTPVPPPCQHPLPPTFRNPQPPTRSARLSSTRRSTSAASGDLLRKKMASLLPQPPINAPHQPTHTAPTGNDDDAQVILEDHCSRIWTDERQRQPLNVCRKSGHRSDVYSISSFDSGVVGGYGGVGGLNSSDSESCLSRGGAAVCRWNYGPPQVPLPPPPPPPMCSYCRRTPSMSSTPGPNRRGGGEYTRWSGVQYQRVQYQHHSGSHHGHGHHSQNYEQISSGVAAVAGVGGRAMRSRSLTSDSPSVFDSGLSSTYDHLPAPPRRSRHDDHKFIQEGPTPQISGRPTPRPADEFTLRLFGDCDPIRSASPAIGGVSVGRLPQEPNLPQRSECQKYGQMVHCQPPSQQPLPIDSVAAKPGLFTPIAQPLGATSSLVVGYYLCDDPVPYRVVWTGPENTTASPSITLGQFKQLVVKKGVYRYFFKTASDDFGTGCVHEEVGDDSTVLPLWEGKVIARVERTD